MQKEDFSKDYRFFVDNIQRNFMFAACIDLPSSPEERKTMEEILPDDTLARMRLELLICRNVESFQQYLSKMIFRVFTERPETMRTSEKVEIREVLECGSMDEFVQYIADRKVNELGYLGLNKLIEYLTTKLGLRFNVTPIVFQAACELIEVRNIIVHNGGYVNRVYLQRTGTSKVWYSTINW